MGAAETAMRTAVALRLTSLYPGAKLLHEVGLDHGQGRADLVVLTPKVLYGVELKSPADNLQRLPEQIRRYGETMDRATLVVCPRLLPAAVLLLPEWWGLWRYTAGGAMEVVRRAQLNPSPSPLTSARLLWREEAMAELKVLGLARGLSRLGRQGLYGKLTKALPPDELRARIRARLLSRQDWDLTR